MPILSSTQTSSTLVPVVACSVVSASQVWTGNIGAFTAKATKKPTNSHFWVVGSMFRPERSLSRYDGVPCEAETT